MKLLVLCLLFGAVVTMTTAEKSEDKMNSGEIANPESEFGTDLSEAEESDAAETTQSSCCRPGVWCSRGSSRYVYIPSARPWAHAQLHCQALGGTLAVIADSAENEFLKSVARGQRAWIGISDAQQEGIWLWINGDRVTFTNFCQGEPNNQSPGQHCALINMSNQKCWDDEFCKDSLPYVCERK